MTQIPTGAGTRPLGQTLLPVAVLGVVLVATLAGGALAATRVTLDFDVLPDGTEPVDGTPVGDAFGELVTAPGGEFGTEFNYVAVRNNTFVTDNRSDGVDPVALAFADTQRSVSLEAKGSSQGVLTVTGYDADGFEVPVTVRYPDRESGVFYLSDVGAREYTRLVVSADQPFARLNLAARSVSQLCVVGGDCSYQDVRLSVDEVTLFADASPAAVFTADSTEVVVGERVAFDATASTGVGGPIVDYQWRLGEAASASESRTFHSFDEPGEYEVELLVVDRVGLSDRTTQAVTVAERNQPPVAVPAVSTTTAVVGEEVVFTAYGSSDDSAVASYTWDFGDGSTTRGSAVAHRFGTAGNFSVALTVADDAGLTATERVVVAVESAPTTGTDGQAGDDSDAVATPAVEDAGPAPEESEAESGTGGAVAGILGVVGGDPLVAVTVGLAAALVVVVGLLLRR